MCEFMWPVNWCFDVNIRWQYRHSNNFLAALATISCELPASEALSRPRRCSRRAFDIFPKTLPPSWTAAEKKKVMHFCPLHNLYPQSQNHRATELMQVTNLTTTDISTNQRYLLLACLFPQWVSLWWIRMCLARLVWYGKVLKHILHLNGARLKWTLTCPTNWWRWCSTFLHTGHWKALPWEKASEPLPRISRKLKPAILYLPGSPS